MNYRAFSQYLRKQAASVMTPEAEQAAMQPPADPSMGGGMPPGGPMPPQGGAPMDPAMAGGPMPPQGGAPMPPQGGIPPEIMQDQAFMEALMQMGVQVDPNSGMCIGPDGQPVPPDMIMQAYQQFQQMMAQQGGMPPGGPMPPQGGAPMDPAMAGGPMPPQGGAPMDPAMAGGPMPPQGGAPMDPAMAGGMPPEGAAPAIPDDIMNQISSAVMSGVESVLQDFSQQIGTVLKDLNDKLDRLSGDISALSDTDDRRSAEDKTAEDQLRADLSADLNPVQSQVAEEEPVKQASVRKLNIFDLINGK